MLLLYYGKVSSKLLLKTIISKVYIHSINYQCFNEIKPLLFFSL